MNHIDLFSGIGGFAYAARQVWGEDYHNVFFCDNNKFCQEVLKKNFGKDITIYDDIKKVNKERFIADTNGLGFQKQGTKLETGRDRQFDEVIANSHAGCNKRAEGKIQARVKLVNRSTPESVAHSEHRGRNGSEISKRIARKKEELFARSDFGVDFITAGFPCQPFSCAGKRKGAGDDRYLWPDMFRVIKEFQPRWVIGENVAGILSVVLPDGSVKVGNQASLFGDKGEEIRDYETVTGRIESDLREAGYETVWFVIPACAIGALHRRDRLWIIAHRPGKGLQEFKQQGNSTDEKKKSSGLDNGFKRHDCDAANAKGIGFQGCRKKGEQSIPQYGKEKLSMRSNQRNATDSECDVGPQCRNAPGMGRQGQPYPWDKESWFEIATALCGMDDGIPVRLDSLKLTAAGHRTERLKGLGNAIVPAVAVEIMKAIKATDYTD